MYNSSPRVCCTCGKTFYPAVMHVYKRTWRKKVYVACSYTCFAKLEEAIEKEKKGGVNKSLDKDGHCVL